jgi:hypothetical protein
MTELDQIFGEHIFDRDTAVQRVAANKYTATLTDRWSTVRGPNGGYCLATGLRALAVEMPLPDPVVTAAFFHAPPASGPVEVDTEIVRRGRRLATGQARVLQGDREFLRALASFADLERTQGRTLEVGAPPSLSEREAIVDLDPGRAFPGATLLDRFNYCAGGGGGGRSGRRSLSRQWCPRLRMLRRRADRACSLLLNMKAGLTTHPDGLGSRLTVSTRGGPHDHCLVRHLVYRQPDRRR